MNKKFTRRFLLATVLLFGLLVALAGWKKSEIRNIFQLNGVKATASSSGNSVLLDPSVKHVNAQPEASAQSSNSVIGHSAYRTINKQMPLLDRPYEQIRDRAKNGDVEASYETYQILKECISLNQQLTILSQQSDVVGSDTDELDKSLNEIENKRTYCAKIDDATEQSMRYWLITAADGGSVDAQIAYFYDGSPIIRDPALLLKEPALGEQYKEKALHYLTQAASTCNVDAALQLATVYYDGIITTRNSKMAIAYLYLANKSNLIKNTEKLYQQWLADLNAEDVSDGVALGENLVSKNCR